MWGNDPLTVSMLTLQSISMMLSNAINEIKNQISSTDILRIVLAEPIQSLYVAADKTRLFEILANVLINGRR